MHKIDIRDSVKCTHKVSVRPPPLQKKKKKTHPDKMHATNDFWDFTQYRRDILSTVTLYFTFLRVKLAISLCFKIHMVYDIPALVCNISLLISSEKGNISVTCFFISYVFISMYITFTSPLFFRGKRVLLHVCIDNFSSASRNVQWSFTCRF